MIETDDNYGHKNFLCLYFRAAERFLSREQLEFEYNLSIQLKSRSNPYIDMYTKVNNNKCLNKQN